MFSSLNDRESGEPSKRKPYLPSEKQFLITRNGKVMDLRMLFYILSVLYDNCIRKLQPLSGGMLKCYVAPKPLKIWCRISHFDITPNVLCLVAASESMLHSLNGEMTHHFTFVT